jgi:hypothetical protein
MLRLATDADVHGDLIRGLRRHWPGIDLVRVQDALPEGTADPGVLAWAAEQGRIVITNDRNTMVGFAYQRVAAGKPQPGLIVTTNSQSIGSAIRDILLLAESMSEARIKGATRGVPALQGIAGRIQSAAKGMGSPAIWLRALSAARCSASFLLRPQAGA